MRRSTPGNSFKSLIKDELVKRFQDLTRDEIRKYESEILENNKKFNLINTSLTDVFEQQKEILTLLQNIKADCKQEIVKEKNDLFEKFECQRRHVNEKIKSIESATKDLFNSCEKYVNKNEFLEQVSILQSQMINIGLNAEKEKKKLCEFIHEIKEELTDLICDLQDFVNKKLLEFNDKFDELREIVETNKIDSTGLLKELQVFKKSVFIIEKNIENIYTKIERLKQV